MQLSLVIFITLGELIISQIEASIKTSFIITINNLRDVMYFSEFENETLVRQIKDEIESIDSKCDFAKCTSNILYSNVLHLY